MSRDLYLLKNIKRVFGQREVLSIESLSIEPGLIYGLMGPNGSGKTTLLKILAFLDEPSAGSVYFEGREAGRRFMAEFRSKVVWSPQFPVMFTGSLRYNVEYPMRIRGVAAALRRRRSEELLARVGLSDLADAPARRLSGGEAQRASLARALAARAEVLLLDEPTANVDASSRSGLVKLIEELRREQNLSIIITTHDQGLEAELCQKRIYLSDGKLASINEITTHQAALSQKNGRFYLTLPPEAGLVAGTLYIEEIAEPGGSAVLLRLRSEERRRLRVKISGDAGLAAARRLSLNEPVYVENI